MQEVINYLWLFPTAFPVTIYFVCAVSWLYYAALINIGSFFTDCGAKFHGHTGYCYKLIPGAICLFLTTVVVA